MEEKFNGYKHIFIIRLLFVDDVLIFGDGIVFEWRAYNAIFSTFCVVSGMLISSVKSSFFQYNIHVEICDIISSFLPYTLSHMELGFTYLGYFLKPTCYLVED